MLILFEPLKIGKLELKNRLVRSATYSAVSDENGFVTEAGISLKRRLAENEIGLIITGFTFVSKNGQRMPDMNGIDTDDHIPGYQKMTGAVHEQDGRIVMQLVHCGVISDHSNQTRGDHLAVSIVDDLPDFRKTARVMADADIEEIIHAFGQSARRAQEAGFDGVQIHAAHGYLVTQFLTPRLNQRTDKWGGSLTNRMRFLLEVVRSIKRNVDPDFPVMVKLGCHDYLDQGIGLILAEGITVASSLENEGVCLIEISTGKTDATYEKTISSKIRTSEKEAYLFEDARAVRQSTSVPLCLVGGLRSLPVIEKVLQSGIVDCVSMCRPLIREPGLIKRWKSGDRNGAACISCNDCLQIGDEGRFLVRCKHTQ
jgi:2,4-dienoyl-CoA reductase-like NADH-dependent reductase (Old Yellow Enzyme family)